MNEDNSGSIPNILYGLPRLPGVISELGAKSNVLALPDVAPKEKQKS